MVEKRSLSTELKTLTNNEKNWYIERESPPYRLDPFIAKDGIMGFNKFGTQNMRELPRWRVTGLLPFICCGVDMLGPFIIK